MEYTKPLFGKQILITRSLEQSFSFVSKLLNIGARPISCPIVSYELIEKEIYNKKIINNLGNYGWIFFTSQNAVKYFFEILSKNYYDSRVLSKNQVAAVGYKTKLELEKYNIKADFVPKRFSFEDLISELNEKTNLKEKQILLPTQVGALHTMPTLQNITEWGIYKAKFVEYLDKEIIDQIKYGIDILTFFSSNTVSHFEKLVEKYDLQDYLIGGTCHGKPLLATIGEETSKTIKEIFGKVDIIAEPFTEDGLIASMEQYFVVGVK